MRAALFLILFITPLVLNAQSRAGLDHAVFFVVTDFQPGWGAIPEAKRETQRIEAELRTRYGFETQIFHNPTREKIRQELDRLTRTPFTKSDQLLIFFSMHGEYEEASNRGYFIPADGLGARSTAADKKWLEHGEVRRKIEAIKDAHVLVSIDACYSGAFSGSKSKPGESAWQSDRCQFRVQQALALPSRYFLSAGAVEVVSANSDFAARWLTALQSNGGPDGILTFSELYAGMEDLYPTPRWGVLNGHGQGNFIFVSAQACAGQEQASVEKDDPRSLSMVKVDGGSFQMGDSFNEGEIDEFPVHEVDVPSFWMDPYEVTFDLYDAFCRETNRPLPSDAGQGRGQKPAVNVSWYDAIEFCNWRSRKMNLRECYTISKNPREPDPNNENASDRKKWTVAWDNTANGFRLPTEAEWEYAARSKGCSQRYGNGSNDATPASVNVLFNPAAKESPRTKPVGAYSPSPLSLFEMSGNVAEWCWDWYDPFYYKKSPEKAPWGPSTGSERVVRGGNYFLGKEFSRATARASGNPDVGKMGVGFRCVRSL